MKYLILLPLLLLGGCFERTMTQGEIDAEQAKTTAEVTERDRTAAARVAASTKDLAKERVIAQAAANLEPIANAVDARGQPGLANVTRDQKRNIDAALDIDARDYPAATLTLKGLLKDAEAERVKAQAKATELQTALGAASALAEKADAERVKAEALADAQRKIAEDEKKRADSEAATAWWLKAGGTALTGLIAAAGLAARLGLPGGGLVSTALNIVSPYLKTRSEVATAAVAAADVGRSALGALDAVTAADPTLAAALSAKISALTGGKVNCVEDLFKLAAKAHTVDEGNHVDGVDKLLNEVRGRKIATTGGIPNTLAALLKAA